MILRIVIPLAGLLMLLLTYVVLSASFRFIREGKQVRALVKDIGAATDGGYYPEFEYEVDGVTYHQSSEISSVKWMDKKGSYHDIIYKKSNPSEIKVVSFWGLFRAPVVISCVAGILLIISGWYYWYSWAFK